MKHFGIAIILFLVVALSGCGSSSSSSINGNWTATLNNQNGPQALVSPQRWRRAAASLNITNLSFHDLVLVLCFGNHRDRRIHRDRHLAAASPLAPSK